MDGGSQCTEYEVPQAGNLVVVASRRCPRYLGALCVRLATIGRVEERGPFAGGGGVE